MTADEIIVTLGAKHIHDPDFIPALRARLYDEGMDEERVDECLEIVLPQMREQAARLLH